MKALASIQESEEENDEGRELACIYATCHDSDQTVGPIWGTSEASIKRALAILTEECDCGAEWHEEE